MERVVSLTKFKEFIIDKLCLNSDSEWAMNFCEDDDDNPGKLCVVDRYKNIVPLENGDIVYDETTNSFKVFIRYPHKVYEEVFYLFKEMKPELEDIL